MCTAGGTHRASWPTGSLQGHPDLWTPSPAGTGAAQLWVLGAPTPGSQPHMEPWAPDLPHTGRHWGPAARESLEPDGGWKPMHAPAPAPASHLCWEGTNSWDARAERSPQRETGAAALCATGGGREGGGLGVLILHMHAHAGLEPGLPREQGVHGDRWCSCLCLTFPPHRRLLQHRGLCTADPDPDARTQLPLPASRRRGPGPSRSPSKHQSKAPD